VALYSRHQLLLILLLAGAAGAGLAIDHWRRARPELAERIEALDRVERREPAPPPRSAARRPRPVGPERPLDVNLATEAELARLPGVGAALAARIVAARPFAEVEDLRRVPGLRRATLERLRPFVTVADDAR
jgi:DNA uptake protein ComE-like DNA-binding protein